MTQAFILPGHMEIWVILFVVLLLFGHRIPAMARSLGSGIVEFKKGLKGDGDDKKKLPPDTDGARNPDKAGHEVTH